MIPILAFFLALSAGAADKDTYDKTYPRDNTFCQIGKTRLEILVRGLQSHTEPEERMWGEYVFGRVGNGPVFRLPVTSESGLYRLFQGNPSSCTKMVGTKVGSKFALLFQKLNSPHKHRLVIQYIDPLTLKPLETVHTAHLTDKALVKNNALFFRTFPPSRQDIEMGKVTIKEATYLYQDHIFPVWVRYDSRGFQTDPASTYENFTYKKYFKTLNDFKTGSGWDEANKSFRNQRLYIAINHQLKSKCLLLTHEKKKFTGEESWICQ